MALGDRMTTFLTVAYASFVAWAARWPSDWLFEAALDWMAEAERWQRIADGARSCGLEQARAEYKRDECIAESERLARKAIRRMPWRLV
jgi:hypothetical protein